MAVKTYDPKQVILTVGTQQITGFADGEMITISKPVENFIRHVGTDGNVSRAKGNDNTYDLTITLAQTSDSNDFLSGVMILDKKTGKGTVPVSIADLSGKTLFFSASTWIDKDPDRTFGKEIGDVAWTMQTGNVDEYFIGGN